MSGTNGQHRPAFSVTEVEILDEQDAARYAQITGPAVARHGGRFLVMAAEPTVAEGDFPAGWRIVVIEFPSMDQLRAWYDSAEYAPARELASTALRRRLLFAEGVAGSSASDDANRSLATVRRFYEAMNTGDMSVADEILTPDWEDIPLPPGTSPGLAGYKQTVAYLRRVFPDMNVTIEEILASGDRVAVRSVVTGTHSAELLGVEPTGREVEFRAFDFHRIEGGRIAQSWHLEDFAGVLQQLREPAPA